MVNITINLDDEMHQALKEKANDNLRSMKNELLFILKDVLRTSPKNAEFKEIGEDKQFVKKVGNQEVSTLFMQKQIKK